MNIKILKPTEYHVVKKDNIFSRVENDKFTIHIYVKNLYQGIPLFFEDLDETPREIKISFPHDSFSVDYPYTYEGRYMSSKVPLEFGNYKGERFSKSVCYQRLVHGGKIFVYFYE